MILALATLAVGILIGFLAQRSRLCFVGGLRDFLLVRDTELLKGALAFFLAAWIAFPLVSLLGGVVWDVATTATAVPALSSLGTVEAVASAADPAPFRPWLPAAIAVVAGTGLGFVSVLANGCPLRQHVLAGQGNRDSWYYLGGLYVGAVLYHTLLQPWLAFLIS